MKWVKIQAGRERRVADGLVWEEGRGEVFVRTCGHVGTYYQTLSNFRKSPIWGPGVHCGLSYKPRASGMGVTSQKSRSIRRVTRKRGIDWPCWGNAMDSSGITDINKTSLPQSLSS